MDEIEALAIAVWPGDVIPRAQTHNIGMVLFFGALASILLWYLRRSLESGTTL